MTSPYDLDFGAIVDALASHAASLGVFDGPVLQHQPVSAPGNGITCAVWFARFAPARGASGLSSTTVLVVCSVRIYTPILSQPPDSIDPNMINALSALVAAYSGDFDLGGQVKQVDLLGRYGTPLSAVSGYQDWNNTQYRVITVNVPVVVNDVWEQNP